LSGWVGATAAALQPLIDVLAAEMMASDTLHVDDTPVPVLAPGTGKTRTGRLWTYVRDVRPFAGSRPPAALFIYSPDRKGEHPQTHLKDFRGPRSPPTRTPATIETDRRGTRPWGGRDHPQAVAQIRACRLLPLHARALVCPRPLLR
jgi:hypothetical protein